MMRFIFGTAVIGYFLLGMGISQAVAPADFGLREGDVISASGSSDPDIYIVNEHGYKRLFLNPEIFKFYGHLGGFQAVKSVNSSTRDAFPTSGLFRNCETNDSKVYGVQVQGEDAGILHWINMTGTRAVQEDPNFFKKIFCINNREFNWYPKSSSYTSLSQVPSYTRSSTVPDALIVSGCRSCGGGGALSTPKPTPTPAVPSPTPTPWSPPQPIAYTKRYSTSFENVADAAGFYITPQNYLGTSHNLVTDIVHSGSLAHKAWILGPNAVVAGQNTNHRGYPTIQLYKRSDGTYHNKVLVELWVWLDIPLEKVENKSWFSFATFTTYADDYWQRTPLVNLDADHHVHIMHVPDQGKAIHDIYQTSTVTFPMRQWVKLTTLIDFTSNNEYNSPYIKAWQDDVLVSAARFNPRLDLTDIPQSMWPACLNTWDQQDIATAEQLCGLTYAGGLAQAHFGMYAPPLLETGTVYNDDLVIYELAP